MISQAAFDGQIENKKHQDMWMKYVMKISVKSLKGIQCGINLPSKPFLLYDVTCIQNIS